MSNLLVDHIDEPIKKVVAGLSLLGINTFFSCCGFSYKGEKVPKKHLKKAYVYIDLKNTSELQYIKLIKLAVSSGWKIAPLQINWPVIDFYAEPWAKDHVWNDESCPHYPEVFVLAISALEGAIKGFENAMFDSAIIEDGNRIYKETFKLKYWQYEPCEPWTVTKEEYQAL